MFASNRFAAVFAGADADAIFQREYENFAVARLTFRCRLTAPCDRFDGRFDEIIVDADHQLHFPAEIDADIAATKRIRAVRRGVNTLDIHDRESKYLHLGQCRFDRFEAFRDDNRQYEFHGSFPE